LSRWLSRACRALRIKSRSTPHHTTISKVRCMRLTTRDTYKYVGSNTGPRASCPSRSNGTANFNTSCPHAYLGAPTYGESAEWLNVGDLFEWTVLEQARLPPPRRPLTIRDR
jgi:hypothetical protein